MQIWIQSTMQCKNLTIIQENELSTNRMSHNNMNTFAAKESIAFYFTLLCKTSLQYDEQPHKINLVSQRLLNCCIPNPA